MPLTEMMRLYGILKMIRIPSACASILLAFAMLLSDQRASHGEQPKQPQANAPIAGRVIKASYYGTVTKVGPNSLWIQSPGQQLPREFPVIPELARGKVPPGGNQMDDLYLLKDVRVGDRVGTTNADDGNGQVCCEITIYRRPGGKIPPGYAPGTEPAQVQLRHHDRMNAHQQLEEHGIPLPQKFAPQILPTD